MADAKQKLIDGLNEDLAAEYQTVVMYRTYAALVTGPSRLELKEFFEEEIQDELGHAAVLADRIVALGGQPTTKVPEAPMASSNKEALENALQGEIDTIERYTKRLDDAEAAGELSIKIQLEDLIVDESNHRDGIRRMLKDWS